LIYSRKSGDPETLRFPTFGQTFLALKVRPRGTKHGNTITERMPFLASNSPNKLRPTVVQYLN
jgi:hypothetical protein